VDIVETEIELVDDEARLRCVTLVFLTTGELGEAVFTGASAFGMASMI
jgi:hypothetical protein